MTRLIFLLLLALAATSCSLDDFLYNEETIDRYDLPTDVISESQRRIVTFESEGHTLYGVWMTPMYSTDESPVVLYCHGNKRHIGEYWDRVGLFHQMGLRCFIFDYRGFGLSEGSPSISGLYADGRAALRYVLDSLHVDSSRLIFYGYSLGNVVSIDLAANVLNPSHLIAEAPFASAEALFQAATPLHVPGGLVIDDIADNVERIRRIRAPLLLLHGSADDFIPFDRNGRVLFERAPEPRELELVARANHTDIPWIMRPDPYRTRILNFLADY